MIETVDRIGLNHLGCLWHSVCLGVHHWVSNPVISANLTLNYLRIPAVAKFARRGLKSNSFSHKGVALHVTLVTYALRVR